MPGMHNGPTFAIRLLWTLLPRTLERKKKGRSNELLEMLDPGFALTEYISIVRQPGTTSLSEAAGKSFLSKLFSFISSRSLLVKLPDLNQIFDYNQQEGRGKKKQGQSMYMMMAMMMAGWMISMKLAAVAAIAGKALAASMTAVLLATLAALKRHEGSGHHKDHYEVINLPASHSIHQRSYDEIDKSNVELTTQHPTVQYYRYAKSRAT